MALTLEDINERLKQVDEISLLEILEIDSVDLVERFQDYIAEKLSAISDDLEDDYESC